MPAEATSEQQRQPAPSYGAPAPPPTPPLAYGGLSADASRAEPSRRGEQRRTLRIGAGLAALVLIAGVLGGLIAHALDGGSSNSNVTSSPVVNVSSDNAKPTEQLAKVAAAVQPSVVSITVTGASGTDEGSGVVLRSDGTVLTNNHVV